MKSNYIECSCSVADHVIRLGIVEDDTMSVEFQLDGNQGFFTKLKNCYRYLFLNMYYSNWTETLLNKEQAKVLKRRLEDFING